VRRTAKFWVMWRRLLGLLLLHWRALGLVKYLVLLSGEVGMLTSRPRHPSRCAASPALAHTDVDW
jgi:hypothetical protein